MARLPRCSGIRFHLPLRLPAINHTLPMVPKFKLALILFSLFSQQALIAGAAPAQAAENLPRVFKANPRALANAKIQRTAGDSALKPAFDRLFSDAARALKIEPHSVMDKHQVPPSGDKHDYVSLAPYYWEDPNSPKGGYVRRDGEHNPAAVADNDSEGLKSVCANAQTLALAYYFSGDETYAAKAAEILRVWFLDSATKMNPNLNFGQGIPGQVTGRPQGLISVDCLADAVDAIGLLAGSKSWTAADQKGMLGWMTRWFEWLTTSEIGLGEAAAKNNHGTCYDVHATVIALFIGNTDYARKTVMDARAVRIARQIEPDGRQPLELARTRSLHYSLKNLHGLIDLATIGENLGVDLWNYATPDGRSISRALEFLAPYANQKKKWPYQQIDKVKYAELGELLMQAAAVYRRNSLSDGLKCFAADELAASRNRLLFKTELD